MAIHCHHFQVRSALNFRSDLHPSPRFTSCAVKYSFGVNIKLLKHCYVHTERLLYNTIAFTRQLCFTFHPNILPTDLVIIPLYIVASIIYALIIIHICRQKRYKLLPICVSSLLVITGFIYFAGYVESFVAILTTIIYLLISILMMKIAECCDRQDIPVWEPLEDNLAMRLRQTGLH